MNKHAVYHKKDSDYCYPVSQEKLYIKLRTAKNDADAVKIYFYNSYMRVHKKGGELQSVVMEKFNSCELFDYFEATLEVAGFISVYYFFEITHGKNKYYYANYKFEDKLENAESNAFSFAYLCRDDLFVIPEWAKSSIVYQIVPDRFAKGNGDYSGEWHIPTRADTKLGGNIKGITKKLAYLSDLGINTIYLTPIFLSESSHKYDTKDYYKIDPEFGTKEDLIELVNEAHKINMKVVLDAVFNHTGTDFFAFKDLITNQENSDFKGWYNPHYFPVEIGRSFPNYSTFGYYGMMPKVMTDHPEAKEYFINVALYWIREADIDGYRLDVADEIDHNFWRDFRRAVKSVKEDALIVGESWREVSSFLNGDQFDSQMNYAVRHDIISLLNGKSTAGDFVNSLGRNRNFFKKEPYSILWNLIGSHDVQRIFNELNGEVDRLKLAIFILLTLEGTPMIYYGDEAAMPGDETHKRDGMVWDTDKRNNDVYEHTKTLIHARNTNQELATGRIGNIEAADGVIKYDRFTQSGMVRMVINPSDKDVLTETGGSFTDLLKNSAVGKNLKVPAMSGIILKKDNKCTR